jgi:hypothetical protein
MVLFKTELMATVIDEPDIERIRNLDTYKQN